MRNTLLTAIVLIGTGSFVAAQQGPPPPPPPAKATAPIATTDVLNQVPGVAVENINNVRVNGQSINRTVIDGVEVGYGSSSYRNIKEEDLKSKEVSKEIATPKGADIYIENTSRGIIVKTWDQQKVKVTTTVYYEGESKLTDDEWLEKSNLSLKTLGNSVKIKSGLSNGTYYSFGNGTNEIIVNGYGTKSTTVFSSNGQNFSQKSNLKKTITITVPAGSKLDIESKYADVEIPDNISDLNLDISNGNLESGNLNKFILRSKYSNINVGDVKTAEVEITNGRFNAKTIDDLDIDSKYSTVEMATAKKIILRSTNDEYEMEEAGEVRGRKNYGNLRITKLNNSLELDGSNADVKVRNVGAALSMIKLDDKYADVRIPLRDTKNYAIDFTGAYSSVYGNFEKKPVAEVIEDKPGNSAPDVQRIKALTLRAGSSWNDNSPARFTASGGDGKGLKIDMKCQNCTVDFK